VHCSLASRGQIAAYRTHNGPFHNHSHFVYRPLKYVQSFETEKLLTPLARSFRVIVMVIAELNSNQIILDL
jgi:hypothetical protein